MQQNSLSDDDLRRAFDAADRMAQQGDQQAVDDARAFAQELQRRGLLGQQASQPSAPARPQLPEWPEDVADRQAREANPQPPQRERTGRIPAFSRGTANVFYLGAADELAGGVENLMQRGANLFRSAGDRVDPNEAGRNATQEVRRLESEAREDRPVTYGTGQVAGGVIQATTLGSGARAIAPAASARYGSALTSRPFATTAATGAVEGGIYGFNEAEGGIQNRLMGGAGGSVLGAIAGPLTMAAIGLGRSGVNWARGRFPGGAEAIDEAVDGVRGSALRFAERAGIGRELRRNPQALAADGESFLAERLGPNSRSTAVGLGGAGDDAQNVAERAIGERAGGRAERVANEVGQATGTRDAAASLMQIDDVRAAARPMFDAADAAQGRMTPRLREIVRMLDRAGVSFRNADEVAAREGGGRVRLSAFTDDLDNLPDQIQLGDVRALARAVENRARRLSREGEDPGELWNMARELRDIIARQSPEYRQAAGLWRSAARDEEAFDIGGQIFRPGARAERDLRRFVTGGATQSERRMFLAGIADAIEQRMGNTSTAGNPAATLSRSRIRDRLNRFLGEDAAEELMQRLDNEMGMSRFENVVNREINSATDARLAGRERVAAARSGGVQNTFAELIADPLEFLRLRGARRQVGEFIKRGDDEAIAEVARVLYSQGNVTDDPLVRAILREADRRGVLPANQSAALSLVAPAQDALTSRDQ